MRFRFVRWRRRRKPQTQPDVIFGSGRESSLSLLWVRCVTPLGSLCHPRPVVRVTTWMIIAWVIGLGVVLGVVVLWVGSLFCKGE